MSSGAWDLQSITTMWASIGHTDTNWTAKAAAFVLNVVIKGFRFIGLFALFPIYLFCIMEFAGYIVLTTNSGVRHHKREAAERVKSRLPSRTAESAKASSLPENGPAPAIRTDELRARIPATNA